MSEIKGGHSIELKNLEILCKIKTTSFVNSRAGGAGPVAQAMDGPIYLKIHVLVACKLSAGDAGLL